MKKSVATALGLAAVIMLILIIVLGVKVHRQTTTLTDTRAAEDSLRTQFNAALVSIAEIQDSLNSVLPAEEQIQHITQGSEMGTPVTQTQKDQMLGTISTLKESVHNSRQRINELEKSLKGSQTRVAGLQKVIDNLKKSVAQKEADIARLSNVVDRLNEQVGGLETTVHRGRIGLERQGQQLQSAGRELEAAGRELSTIYYIIGTRKELKEKGVLSESGGLVGIGRSTQVSGSFHPEDFQTLDTDNQTELPILGSEPQVLSAQSTSSYQLETGTSSATLRITDPQEFRKVKYLVIAIKERT